MTERQAAGPGNPLSSAQLRNAVRPTAVSDAPGPPRTRPFGLRFTHTIPTPIAPAHGYCPRRQVAIDVHGRPLLETMAKDWKSTSSTDGDEGPEENWGWEEG